MDQATFAAAIGVIGAILGGLIASVSAAAISEWKNKRRVAEERKSVLITIWLKLQRARSDLYKEKSYLTRCIHNEDGTVRWPLLGAIGPLSNQSLSFELTTNERLVLLQTGGIDILNSANDLEGFARSISTMWHQYEAARERITMHAEVLTPDVSAAQLGLRMKHAADFEDFVTANRLAGFFVVHYPLVYRSCGEACDLLTEHLRVKFDTNLTINFRPEMADPLF